jgi:hypothetical protein
VQHIAGTVIDGDVVMLASFEQFTGPPERLVLAGEFFGQRHVSFLGRDHSYRFVLDNPIRHRNFPNEWNPFPRSFGKVLPVLFKPMMPPLRKSHPKDGDLQKARPCQDFCGMGVAF